MPGIDLGTTRCRRPSSVRSAGRQSARRRAWGPRRLSALRPPNKISESDFQFSIHAAQAPCRGIDLGTTLCRRPSPVRSAGRQSARRRAGGAPVGFPPSALRTKFPNRIFNFQSTPPKHPAGESTSAPRAADGPLRRGALKIENLVLRRGALKIENPIRKFCSEFGGRKAEWTRRGRRRSHTPGSSPWRIED